MRVMVIVKATQRSEAGEMPTAEELNAMGKFNTELVEAGVMVDGDGLRPSSKGARVIHSGGKVTVVDGPFAETKELVAGYWVLEVGSVEEAIGWMKKAPNPRGEEWILEIRPFSTAEDFGEAFTPEMQAAEDALRDRVAAQQGD